MTDDILQATATFWLAMIILKLFVQNNWIFLICNVLNILRLHLLLLPQAPLVSCPQSGKTNLLHNHYHNYDYFDDNDYDEKVYDYANVDANREYCEQETNADNDNDNNCMPCN